jgi:hypothetical protein
MFGDQRDAGPGIAMSGLEPGTMQFLDPGAAALDF